MIGNLRIGPEIGRGASGRVYEGSGGGHVVAVKRPRSPDAINRLMEEARTLSMLDHPNVVRYIDILDNDREFCLLMERVDGVPLSHLMGRIPCSAAIYVVRSILSGLTALHELGVVHRDVSPSNVMVARDGRVVIMDLGLALSPSDDLREIAGTPRYMAPEQFERGAIDERADLYAVGVILWELLTGRCYGRDAREDARTVVARRMTASRPLVTSVRDFTPEVPVSLDQVTQRLMAQTTAERFPSALAAIEALPDLQGLGVVELVRALRTSEGSQAQTRNHGSLPWLALASLGAALAFTLGVNWSSVARGASSPSGVEIPLPTAVEASRLVPSERAIEVTAAAEPAAKSSPKLAKKSKSHRARELGSEPNSEDSGDRAGSKTVYQDGREEHQWSKTVYPEKRDWGPWSKTVYPEGD